LTEKRLRRTLTVHLANARYTARSANIASHVTAGDARDGRVVGLYRVNITLFREQHMFRGTRSLTGILTQDVPKSVPPLLANWKMAWAAAYWARRPAAMRADARVFMVRSFSEV
jgi:hypothetical protein